MEKQLDKELYLSIGQFAQVSGISRKNLIYYDSIGLFCPEVVLDNGYRYYYYRQLYTLNMIWTLKEVGMSLEEIKQFTKGRTPEKMISLFERQKGKIEAEIYKLLQIKDMMTMQVATAKMAETVEVGTIGIEKLEQEPIFLGPTLDPKQNENITLSKQISKFYQYAHEHGYECAFPWGIHIHYHDKGDYRDVQFYYRVPISTTYKAAGTYIVGYTYGDYANLEEFHQKIFTFAKEHGFTIQKDVYEDYLLNEISTQTPEQYILRIAVKIG